MSTRTRSAASSLSLSIAPIISVFTGPAAGKVSMIASDWKRIAASASSVENTPHEPLHGSVRSSYRSPSTSKPLTNVSAQSLRLLMSEVTISSRSSASEASALSSISSARLASNSPLSSASGSSVISTLPSDKVTCSGSTISISRGLSPPIASTSSSMLVGAEYNPLSIELVAIFVPC